MTQVRVAARVRTRWNECVTSGFRSLRDGSIVITCSGRVLGFSRAHAHANNQVEQATANTEINPGNKVLSQSGPIGAGTTVWYPLSMVKINTLTSRHYE